MRRQRETHAWLRQGSMTMVAVLFVALTGCDEADDHAASEQRDPLNPSAPMATEAEPKSEEDEGSRAARHRVTINRPDGPPTVKTGEVDPLGRPVTASCTTCHATRRANPDNTATSQLDEFHQGLAVQHGELSCLACHNPENYDTLRLADGSTLPYEQVMKLCGQCHGPQMRDYRHGSHGGMTGYWDLSRGPRHRNNCVDCHDPHAPAYPKVRPVFPPRDRFLESGHAEHDSAASAVRAQKDGRHD